jgi:hypothetical protein
MGEEQQRRQQKKKTRAPVRVSVAGRPEAPVAAAAAAVRTLLPPKKAPTKGLLQMMKGHQRRTAAAAAATPTPTPTRPDTTTQRLSKAAAATPAAARRPLLHHSVLSLLNEVKASLPKEVYEYNEDGERWHCGATAGALQDAVEARVRELRVVRRVLPLSRLRAMLQRERAARPGDVAFIRMNSGGDPFTPLPHTMTWVLAGGRAYTLQSWVNEVPPGVWHMSEAEFLAAVDVIAAAAAGGGGAQFDDAYKFAVDKLAHVGVGQAFWDRQQKQLQVAAAKGRGRGGMPAFQFMFAATAADALQ